MSYSYRDNPAFDAQREKLDQEAVYSASVVLLERLQEHHDFSVPDRRAAKPVIPAPVPSEPEKEKTPPPISAAAFRAAHELMPQPEGFSKVESIMKAVLEYYPGVSMIDLKSKRRDAAIVKPRQIAMYLAKNLTLRSLPDIGRRFGNRDHTTVIHAVRKIKALVGNDSDVTWQIEQIQDRFQAVAA